MSSMQGMYSMRSPAVKRLMKEAQELREPTEQYHAQPLEDNLFEWHFTIRGPGESEFDGGLYHGRIILPPEYPMKPPSIILLTPNGRFEVFKKICLSISGHHPESWQPSWSIRTALLAIIGFMPTHGAGAIGSLDYSKEERAKLAKRSLEWKCPTCGQVQNILKPVTSASQQTRQEAKELAAQINFQGEKSMSTSSESPKSPGSTPTPVSTAPTPTHTATSTATPTSSLPDQAQFTPPLGQFPFGSPYFPYPFPPTLPTGQNVTTGVMGIPRFPPPPPAIPAMFPPGLMPNYGFGGMPQIPNSMFSMPTSVPSPTQLNKDPATNMPSAQSQPTTKTETPVKSENATPSSGANKDEKDPHVSSSEQTADADSDDINNPDNANAATATEATESQSNPTTTETTGVRQRLGGVVTEPPNMPYMQPPVGLVGQNAELPRNTDSRWQLSTLLIALVSLAIGLLLLRRFILSRTWRFYYGL
ncbi:proline-rich receptor-like protein kinase PERK9 [Mizuhopecten yessoensis]|uniref:Ubiquitin-conjugating enzyme E2 J1 n=1 Tax=Mizuhopecten yessoensis TaxID=6573 RepID=A0A210QAY9_MIZYE|nr:proline-rich receptor-like protein kinase PERK9 [Mizuhopecten yessoensis]OWF45894.1 Ubiquitin-conjugating enzyme E2 J1 [Mizuhopecten yessoensis]